MACSESARVTEWVPADFPHRDIWTVRLGPSPSARETVVLVPPSVPLAKGFARALELLKETDVVRLVGRGTTDPIHRSGLIQPSTKTLFLSELEAYRLADRSAAIASMIPSLEGWLRSTLSVVPGNDPAEVFWTASMYLLFDRIEDYLLAEAIKTLHPDDRIECLDPTWSSFRYLSAKSDPQRRRSLRWRFRFLASWLALIPSSLGKRTIAYVRQTASRRRLRTLRDSNPAAKPKVWVGIVGDSPWISRPVLELIKTLDLQPSEQLGILLQSRLDRGLRRTAVSDVDPNPVLPCLDEPALRNHIATVDQGVSVECFRDLFSIFLRSVSASTVAARNVLLHPPAFEYQGSIIPVDTSAFKTAKMCTLGVLRANEAARASERMCERVKPAGSVVLLAQSHFPNDVVVSRTLDRHGAITAELEHGGLVELSLSISASRCSTKARVLWTIDEAKALQPLRPNQIIVGGYLPRAQPPVFDRPPRDAKTPFRIVVASNYLPAPWGGDLYKWDAFQAPLLTEGADLLRLGDVELRWRPHPSDDAERIAVFRGRFPQYKSSSKALDEDLKWCDVLVTSLSSIIVEALAYGIPIMVHDIPLQSDTIRRVISSERLFGATARLRDRVAPILSNLRAGRDVLGPERDLQARLFGPLCRPRPPRDLLDQRCYRAE